MNYSLIFVGCLLATIIINRLLLAFAKNLGTRGKETIQVRWASTSKPSLGGIAFFMIFMFTISFIGILGNNYTLISSIQMLGLFFSITLGFLIGFADDTYNTNPLLKFFGQLMCAILLIYFDIYISIFPNYQFLNYILTIFWIIGIMNSINMLDNMDGIVASISIVIIISILGFINFIYNSDVNINLILLTTTASLLGFLYHNWFPSKIYMGDAGSQFLGAFLGAFSIIFIWNSHNLKTKGLFPFELNVFLTPILVFIIPIIDTATVIIRRILNGKSPFIGGSDHTTHHFVYAGFNERQVALLLITLSAFSSLIAYFYITELVLIKGLGKYIAIFYISTTFFVTQFYYNKGLTNKSNGIIKSNETKSRKSIVNTIKETIKG